jgi:type 1 glutamine amidotransferase
MEKITKKFFRNYLVDNGITNAVMVSYPDWNGGCDYVCILNGDEDKIREGLRDFEYIEEVFTSEDLIKYRNDEVILSERNNNITMCRLWQMVACPFGVLYT